MKYSHIIIFIICLSVLPYLSYLKSKPKVVLHWTGYYDKKYAHISTLNINWYANNCPVGNCVGTMDRGQLHLADALVFHFYHTDWLEGDMPWKRSPSQHYVAWINEHADYTRVTQRLEKFPKDFINLSMTYRLDSHLPLPYISTVELPQHRRRNLEHILKKVKSHPKNKSVAWFVSHCNTKSDRESYVKELQKYIDVDIYGDCGPLKCRKKAYFCYKMLERDYKFYLSFENSMCKDYVTEKLEKILQYDIIPVTLGGANYSRVAPPHSFINALDYKSPKKLADYLHSLSNNQTEYLKYFEWKMKYSVFEYKANTVNAFCKLCAILNNKVSYVRHEDFLSWWLPSGICKLNKFHFE